MKKEDEKNNQQQVPGNTPAAPAAPAAPPASQTPEEDEFFSNLEKLHPDLAGNREGIFKAAKEGYDRDHEYSKTAKAEAASLHELLSSNPDINDFFIDLHEFGKQGHPEIAFAKLKPIYQQFINGELTSDELQAELDKAKAEDARAQELNKMREEAWAEECKARGWDPKETIEKLQSLIGNNDSDTKEACKKQVSMMLRILEFDDAVAAAETKGRNAKIEEQKRNHPAGVDAMPRNGGAPTGGTQPKKTLFSSAADRAAKQREQFS